MSQRILSDFANEIIEGIRNQLVITGAQATGKTAKSLSFMATDSRLLVYGGGMFGLNKKATPFVEGGRSSGGMPPHQAIKDWVIARGIPVGATYAIRRKIAEKGTNLWINNDRRDIISNVVTDEKINTLLDAINTEALKIVEFDVFNTFKDNTKAA